MNDPQESGLTIDEAVERGLLVDEHPATLRGRPLRFVLVDELRGRESMTVADMVAFLADLGFRLPGRASKVISDALRWELARGRVVRLARGLYRYGRAPKSTARRIRILAIRCRHWVVAAGSWSVPPSPSSPPSLTLAPPPSQTPAPPPPPPPWDDLGWLWAA